MSERAAEITTRLRLLAVPENGVIARGQYSQSAIHEMEQDGLATPVELDRWGRVRRAVLSAQGRLALNRILRERRANV